ncbi:MBL fold metallo-hydrolase [Dokdonella sp.]|uniref:MBL fold metallo-hydrolase n=1 Tax=Dokdonella sp. TaxID=2291710 RepID=UPI002F3EB158
MNTRCMHTSALYDPRTFLAALFTLSASPWAAADVTSPVLKINASAETTPVATQALRGNISVLTGSGGNIAVLSSADGKLLVDSGIAVSRPRLAAALDAISPAPLEFVVNTHYHWDHTDGNAWTNQEGATIVAHENTLKRLAAGTRVIEWGYTFPPLAGAGLPTVLVRNEQTIPFHGETVILKHYGAGHTDTDLSVYFKNADVLQMGDIWWNGHYPFIDYGAGGSIDGMIRWTNACLASVSANTLIVPGHGPVGDRTQLLAYRDMLVAVRQNVARLKKEGKTLAEVVAAKPTAAYDAQYGDFVIDPAFFTQLVYMGL